MNIETEKKLFPKYNLRRWTHSAIYCLKRGCVCQGCIYSNILESTKCKLKIAVILLTEKFGPPTKERMELYREIEKGNRCYERNFKY